jgi:hypothetical protein
VVFRCGLEVQQDADTVRLTDDLRRFKEKKGKGRRRAANAARF